MFMTLDINRHMWRLAAVVVNPVLRSSVVSYVIISSLGVSSAPVYWASAPDQHLILDPCAKSEKCNISRLNPQRLAWQWHKTRLYMMSIAHSRSASPMWKSLLHFFLVNISLLFLLPFPVDDITVQAENLYLQRLWVLYCTPPVPDLTKLLILSFKTVFFLWPLLISVSLSKFTPTFCLDWSSA